MHHLYRIMLALTLTLSSVHSPAQELAFDLADDAEIIAYRYPAEGDYLLLWLAPEYGFPKAHRLLAEQLAAAGIEVWQMASTPRSNGTLRSRFASWMNRSRNRRDRHSANFPTVEVFIYHAAANRIFPACSRAYAETWFLPQTGQSGFFGSLTPCHSIA